MSYSPTFDIVRNNGDTKLRRYCTQLYSNLNCIDYLDIGRDNGHVENQSVQNLLVGFYSAPNNFIKFAIKRFVFQLKSKMLSVTDGHTDGQSELQKQLRCFSGGFAYYFIRLSLKSRAHVRGGHFRMTSIIFKPLYTSQTPKCCIYVQEVLIQFVQQ